MQNLILLLIILLISPASWAATPSPGHLGGTSTSENRTIKLTTTVPAANGNFRTVQAQNANVENFTLRSQSCPFVEGDTCASNELGLVRNCAGTGMVMCNENGTWGGFSGTSMWKKITSTPGVTSIVDNIPSGTDLRVGINIDDPRANLHISAASPIRDNTSLMLQHDAANSSTWSWVVEDAGFEEGVLSLNGQVDPGNLQNKRLLVATHNGEIFISDNFEQHVAGSVHAKLNVQNNENAFFPPVPGDNRTFLDQDKLGLIIGMSKDEFGNPTSLDQGTGIGFASSPNGTVTAAIASKMEFNDDRATLHFFTKPIASDPRLYSALSISPRGKTVFGNPVGVLSDRLSVEGDFSMRGTYKIQGDILLQPNTSGTPNVYSVSGLKTEPSLTGGVPTSNNNAATTEFVQNAVVAAAASGSCFVLQREVTNGASDPYNDDQHCIGGAAAGGLTPAFTCPGGTVPYPTLAAQNGYTGYRIANMHIGGHSYCQYLCCAP